ncbi:GNAT superfamily N-acetyltransferase [Chitinivorax tropicus]|uniref:GNAT superfamily N-acetyltransferase n=1 Tax=Chitinivorax tropicus TaxID=714531 RepID=A0A840MPT0_9PROT|nr:GNAT family N-acetyltransferase [Chitinivorax tropicus]MBB5019099.1 GNAT superfamily N-acetyltransferase [Chitinivorax tropicus]
MIRLARQDDLAGILALYRALHPTDTSLNATEARADDWARVLACPMVRVVVAEAETDHCLAATCTLTMVPNITRQGRSYGLIEHVITLPACRRQGHARQVLQYALAQAWAAGCYKVMLLSGTQRADAHALYESVGFTGGQEAAFVARPPSPALA